ncbi:hypothetical protein J132_10537 [Termitomyces sp. J132]|nr:hypothetical protein J132_10537 [Termitomyces sp. J132]
MAHSNQAELLSGFVNDVMFLAVAKSLKETHIILKDVMECADGAFDWSLHHNSPFKLTKLALMNFPCTKLDTPPQT